MEAEGYMNSSELHTIIENLDADDESDSSDIENDVSGKFACKRSRKASLQRPPVHNGKNNSMRRKTSCNDILPLFNKDNHKQSDASLPSITRSMSLPERLERCEIARPPKGSKSATERLQLPDITRNKTRETNTTQNLRNSRNFKFLPTLGKCDSPNFSLAFRKKNSADKNDLDMFMRNHFR